MLTPVSESEVTCAAHADLLRAAESCDRCLAALERDPRFAHAHAADREDARRMLTDLARYCRRASEGFALDPTLADEPWIREVAGRSSAAGARR